MIYGKLEPTCQRTGKIQGKGVRPKMAAKETAVQKFIDEVLGPNLIMPEDPNHPWWFQILKARLWDVERREKRLIWRLLGEMRFLKGCPTGDPTHNHHSLRQDFSLDVLLPYVQGYFHVVPDMTGIDGSAGELSFWGYIRDGRTVLGRVSFSVEKNGAEEYWKASNLWVLLKDPEDIVIKLGVTAKGMFLAICEDHKWVLKRRQEYEAETATWVDGMELENSELINGIGG